MTDDLDEMVRQDIEQLRRLATNRQDTGLPVLIEVVLWSLTAVVAIVWLLAMFWTPDPIPAGAWLGLGMLGLGLFGLPAGAMYVLRNGGATVIRGVVRELVR